MGIPVVHKKGSSVVACNENILPKAEYSALNTIFINSLGGNTPKDNELPILMAMMRKR